MRWCCKYKLQVKYMANTTCGPLTGSSFADMVYLRLLHGLMIESMAFCWILWNIRALTAIFTEYSDTFACIAVDTDVVNIF